MSKEINLILPKTNIQHIGSSAVLGAISKGDLDIYVGVGKKDFSKSRDTLRSFGLKVKENTFQSEELCMFETAYQGVDVGVQLVDSTSSHTNFLEFRDLLLNSKKLLDEYNKLKRDAINLSPFEYRKIKSKFILSSLSLNKISEKELKYLNSYFGNLKDVPDNPKVGVGIAGNLEIADELLDLYLSGKKTAASGLIKD